ncbi:MAG: DUF4241 domain-containing protein [Planctomycetes bacterium]|nr:DUF4241 domain-containing protein [Planctomycetota bacterium]
MAKKKPQPRKTAPAKSKGKTRADNTKATRKKTTNAKRKSRAVSRGNADAKKGFVITTQRELHQRLPKGHESDWIEFATLRIVSGKLRVSDPMFFCDHPPSPTFDVERGMYRVMVKRIAYHDNPRISRLRAILEEPSSLGLQLADVGVDFAQVGVFDPVVLEEAGENMDIAAGEKMVADLGAIDEFGIVQLGGNDIATMPVAVSGMGDGRYPILELLLDQKRVGVEVVFIGPEVVAD